LAVPRVLRRGAHEILSVAHGRQIFTSKQILSVAFSPDGALFATGADRVHVWEPIAQVG
jgi:hypothetical protein